MSLSTGYLTPTQKIIWDLKSTRNISTPENVATILPSEFAKTVFSQITGE